MKVKFYKGPYHGKVRIIPDHLSEVFVADMARDYAFNNTSFDPYTPVPVTKHLYVWSEHTHPDGSRFFVYKGKR